MRSIDADALLNNILNDPAKDEIGIRICPE